MAMQAIHLRYELTRAQRFGPLMKVWAPHVLIYGSGLVISVLLAAIVSAWFLLAAGAIAIVTRGFLAGIIELLVVPVREMDVIVSDDGLTLIEGDTRLEVPPMAMLRVARFRDDVWTVQHRGGRLIHLPADQVPQAWVEQTAAAIEAFNATCGSGKCVTCADKEQALQKRLKG